MCKWAVFSLDVVFGFGQVEADNQFSSSDSHLRQLHHFESFFFSKLALPARVTDWHHDLYVSAIDRGS
jgi:hypothetical protein